MAKSKYSILKGKTGKSKKVVVAGKKKVLYKKIGTSAMYVLSKGRHIKLSAYKKSKMKGGGEGQEGGKRKRQQKRRGGTSEVAELFGKLTGGNGQDGGKRRKKRRRKSKK